MNQNIEQHFRPDEAATIAEIEDWIVQAADQYRPVLSPFLNPRQQYIAQTIVNRNDDVKADSFGGFDEAEMRRILFYPDYYQPQRSDFNVAILRINYPNKFAQLSHRQVLGTFLNKGIKRETFGDIVTDGQEAWQVFVDQAMLPFFDEQIDQIGGVNVRLEETTAVIEPQIDWETVETTVSSNRLDSIVSAAFNYSRSRTKELIERGYVQVNWAVSTKPDYQIVQQDLLSVRHAGRVRVDNIATQLTKKGKLRVNLAVVHAHQ